MNDFADYFAREVARLWIEWVPTENLDRHESGAAFIAFARAQYESGRGENKQSEQTNLFGE